MRHAKQSDLGTSDHERPLTDEGRNAAHQVGVALHEREALPERGLCSTALRCRQTWETLLRGAKHDLPADFDAELYNASASDILKVLAGANDTTETLLLLAHNPGMSILALALGGGDEDSLKRLRAGFRPGTTATFEIDGPWSTVSAQTARLIRFDPI